jgi:hypothetical protein
MLQMQQAWCVMGRAPVRHGRLAELQHIERGLSPLGGGGVSGKQGVVVLVKNCNKLQNTPTCGFVDCLWGPLQRECPACMTCAKPWHVYMLVQGWAAMFCSLAKHFFRLGHNQCVYAAGDHVGL